MGEKSFSLQSSGLRKVLQATGDFHDAHLMVVNSQDASVLAAEVRAAIFRDEQKTDYTLIYVHFVLNQPRYATNWGSDEEICSSSIYSFEIADNKFDLQTGDGGRAGTCDLTSSTVMISANDPFFDWFSI